MLVYLGKERKIKRVLFSAREFSTAIVYLNVGDCIDWDLGMENGLIPNERITSSSAAYVYSPAHFGRLNDVRGSWCADDVLNEYLQIDLKSLHVICAVSTQGRGFSPLWVKKYTLQLSTDNKTWKDYKENGLVKVSYKVVDIYQGIKV